MNRLNPRGSAPLGPAGAVHPLRDRRSLARSRVRPPSFGRCAPCQPGSCASPCPCYPPALGEGQGCSAGLQPDGI